MENWERRFGPTGKEQSSNIKCHFLILGASSTGPHREIWDVNTLPGLRTCYTEGQTLLLSCLAPSCSSNTPQHTKRLTRNREHHHLWFYLIKKWVYPPKEKERKKRKKRNASHSNLWFRCSQDCFLGLWKTMRQWSRKDSLIFPLLFPSFWPWHILHTVP